MKGNLLKYKHYLIFLTAILLAKYILEPLIENQQDLRQNVTLSTGRIKKVEELIKRQSFLQEQQKILDVNLSNALPLLNEVHDEANFKLIAQQRIEKVLTESGCQIEQMGWKGMSSISPVLNVWHLDASYKGDISCLLKATRSLEELMPLVRINKYFYGGKKIEKNPSSRVTAQLELIMWQYTDAEEGI